MTITIIQKEIKINNEFSTRKRERLLSNNKHRTDRIAVVTVVVVSVEVTIFKIQVPSVVRIVRIERARPIVAVVACVAQSAIFAIASSRKEENTLPATKAAVFR